MNSYTLHELSVALGDLGMTPGRTAIVWSDLTRLGKCSDAPGKTQLLEGILGTMRRLLGPEGTLVVPSWNTDILDSGEDFVYETTPSKAGVFSEFVRRAPGSVRSLHPLVSYCATGKDAVFICEGVSRSAYGIESPFDRLLHRDTLGVSIGLPASQTCSIVHHVEMMMGAPYRYHKEFTFPVWKGGSLVPGGFYLYVRNLDADIRKDGNQKLFERFYRMGFQLGRRVVGGGAIEAYAFRDLYRACTSLLVDDIYGLLQSGPSIRPPRV